MIETKIVLKLDSSSLGVSTENRAFDLDLVDGHDRKNDVSVLGLIRLLEL